MIRYPGRYFTRQKMTRADRQADGWIFYFIFQNLDRQIDRQTGKYMDG